MKVESQKEHQWLQKLVGKWTFEVEAQVKEGEAPSRSTGTETVRSIGELWILAEGESRMPVSGEPATTVMTLGYDPQRKRFAGTWVGSMMTHMWLYDGELDAAEKVLTLETMGPDMAGEGRMGKYRDVIELVSPNHRTLTSYVLTADGEWRHFVKSHYRRK